jgi:uncharacterized membrane protein
MKTGMSQAPSSSDSVVPRSRIDLVDIARGLALLAMFVFHFAFDLSYFGLIDVDVAVEPGWRMFARLIAGSFLALVGVSLVLATRHGLNRPAYLKRLAMVAAAATLVTLGTFLAIRPNFVFFGILHHVALASVLALPFLRLPTLAIAAAAALAFALPGFVAHPWLDQPWAAWLGFSRAPLRSADFVPLFPWFGCVLGGMALARLALPRLGSSAWARWRATALPARLIAWGGRHSLLVYLVHQPVFIGLILLAMQFAIAPAPEERPFLLSCQRSCVRPNLPAQDCEKLCGCTMEALKREGLWRKVLDNTLDPEETARTTRLAHACFASPSPRP